MYTACFSAAEEKDRNYDISYCVSDNDGVIGIECYIGGGSARQSVVLSGCGEEKAEKIASLFAKMALRPLHLSDAVADLGF